VGHLDLEPLFQQLIVSTRLQSRALSG